MKFNQDLLETEKREAECRCGGIYRRLYVSAIKKDSKRRTWLATIYRMCENCGVIVETRTKNKPKPIIRRKYIRRLFR